MKNMKKLASLLLALVMVFSLATTASAATITIAQGNGSGPITGHSYEVYQIFTGELNGTTLSNIKYGANYTPDNTKTGDLVPETELSAIGTTEADAKTFAKKLVDEKLLVGSPVATLGGDTLTATVVDGYYLIIDKGGNVAEGDALSAYIVEVVDAVIINPKSETTTSDKVISTDDYADNNGDDDSVTTDGMASNGAVGSTVNFTLTVDVPSNAANYSYYYCVLNDTLSAGLDFNNDIVVKVGTDTLSSNTDDDEVNDDYALYTGDDADGKTFQVAMLDAASLAGKTITVTYSATINDKAVIGVAGNPNTFDVAYSNNPEHKYDDNNNNGKPDDETSTPTGTTPDKTTYSYVTGVKLIKVDQDGNVLTGAEFEISGDSVKYVLTSEETFDEATDGTYYKLANNTYTTEAPRTADEYVEKTDRDGGYVEDANADGGYRVATEDELNGSVQLYTLLKANSDSYANDGKLYKKTITYTVKGDNANEDIETYVGADGVVYFSGLGEGVYTIKETDTPDGYNTISDITLTIDWTAPANYATSSDCTWKATASNVTGDLTLNDEGVFELTIVNKAGSNLPETGGMGTTLFYVFGGILVLAAVVLLVTKKRMSAAE